MSTKFLSPGWRMPRNANQSKFSNYSIDFEGTDYIDCGDDNMFSFGNGTTDSPFSVSFWAKLNSVSGTQPFLSKDTTSPNREWAISIFSDSSNGVRIFLKNQGGDSQQSIDSSTALTTGVWYHITTTYDGRGGSDAADGLSIYINGSLDTPTNISKGTYTAMSNTTAPVYIGKYSTSEINGKITEVSIFDYALSASQVTTLYGTGSAIGNPMALPSSPIAYYPLGTSAWNGQYLAENNAIGDYVFDFIPNDCIDSNFSLTTGQTQFSASIWVKFTGSLGNDESLIANESGYTADGFAIFKNASNQIVFKCENQSATGTTTIALNKWYLATATYNAGAMVLYVNGQQEATQTTATSITQPSNPKTRLGKYITGSIIPFTGELSNAQIFNTALSGLEVETLYNYGSPIQTLANIPQSSSLKAWYKLDASEVYNSTSAEWSVDNNQNPSAYPSSLDFDGNTNYISTATLSSFITNNVSVSAWVNFTTLPSGLNGAFLGMNNSFEEGLNFCSVGGVIRFTIEGYDTNYVANTVTLVAGQWYHFCGTWDGSTIELFTNGASQGTFAYNGSISTSRVLEIGRVFNNGYNIDGKISNVAIWNTGLLGTEVETIYNNGTPLTDMSSFSSLVSWWKLNNTTTGIEDSKGTNNGTNNGATEYPGFVNALAGDSLGMSQTNLVQSDLQTVAPYSKYAMKLDDATLSDYINVPNNSTLQITGNLTLSSWVRVDGSYVSNGHLIAKQDSYVLKSHQSSLSNVPRFQVNDGSFHNLEGPSVLALDTWHHIAGVRDGNSLKLYVNGALVASSTPTIGNLSVNTHPVQFNAYTSAYSSDLSLSNNAIWNVALNTSEIREIYNEGLPSNLNTFSGTAPISWWQLGENSSFDGSNWKYADEMSTGNNADSVNTAETALTNGVGTTANGVSTGMSEGSLVGDAPYSTANALSSGMAVTSRGTDVPPTP